MANTIFEMKAWCFETVSVRWRYTHTENNFNKFVVIKVSLEQIMFSNFPKRSQTEESQKTFYHYSHQLHCGDECYTLSKINLKRWKRVNKRNSFPIPMDLKNSLYLVNCCIYIFIQKLIIIATRCIISINLKEIIIWTVILMCSTIFT